MKAALIDEKTNQIVNVIELEKDSKWEAPARHFIKFSEAVSMEDIFDGQEIIKPPSPLLIVDEVANLKSEITIERLVDAILGKDNGWLMNQNSKIIEAEGKENAKPNPQ